MTQQEEFTDFVDDEYDDEDAPPRDRIPVRSLRADDLADLVRIDKRNTGLDRTTYYESKLKEAMEETGVRVSLAAEIDDYVAGFLMARVDFGEFGRADPAALIDIIDVDPMYRERGVGHALMSQLMVNLRGLGVDTARTSIRWDRFELLHFFDSCGFKPSQRLILTRQVPAA